MSLARIHSRALSGLTSPEVTVEVHVGNGLPAFNMVGLPDTEVRESKERVRAALLQCGYDFPNRRITVNLAPADLPKDSGRFDLPIALGILSASGQLQGEATEERLKNLEFVGELSLSGELRPVFGALAMASASQSESKRQLVLPICNAEQVNNLPGFEGQAAAHLQHVVDDLLGRSELTAIKGKSKDSALTQSDRYFSNHSLNPLHAIKGQFQAKRALAIAAAGGHSLLMIGPPGSGKTSLAQAMPSLLPPLDVAQAREVMVIHDLRQKDPIKSAQSWRWGERPYRSPHHTASSAALIGGGSPPRPGEVSYAHHGVLFLDELAEFSRSSLEALREPLETGSVRIARSNYYAEFPASFQLVAAMNPCPCGYFPQVKCRCSKEAVDRYQARVSGPLLDRIDIRLQIEPVNHQELLFSTSAGPSEDAGFDLNQVFRAFEVQFTRQGKPNARLGMQELETHCAAEANASDLLIKVAQQKLWSSRASHRVLRVARTIADLEGSPGPIKSAHLAEACFFHSHSIH